MMLNYRINEEEIISNRKKNVKIKLEINKFISFKYFNKTQTLNGKEIEIEDNEKHKYFLKSWNYSIAKIL